MRRRIDIEPDDIGELFEEARTVRRESVRRPDALNRAQAHAGCLCHASTHPVGPLAGRRRQREIDPLPTVLNMPHDCLSAVMHVCPSQRAKAVFWN